MCHKILAEGGLTECFRPHLISSTNPNRVLFYSFIREKMILRCLKSLNGIMPSTKNGTFLLILMQTSLNYPKNGYESPRIHSGFLSGSPGNGFGLSPLCLHRNVP